MTVSELYHSVAQLGFEDVLEYDVGFYLAANRAILQINAIRPHQSHCVIRHRTPENSIIGATTDPVDKIDDLIFEAEAVVSYYFEADGEGVAYIERYDEAADAWSIIGAVNFNGHGGFLPHRGFIKRDGAFYNGRVRLRFTGQYVYTVRGVAMYAHLYGSTEAEIPAYEAFTRYDISAMADDFMRLASPPIEEGDELRRLSGGYDVEDERVILLPRGAEGTYKVMYHRRPAALVDEGAPAEDSTVIDLDAEAAAMMPLLVAAYLWLDDEPEKAQYYMNLYSVQAAEYASRLRSMSPVTFKDVYGW